MDAQEQRGPVDESQPDLSGGVGDDEVRNALEREARLMTLPRLPETGPIPDALKAQILRPAQELRQRKELSLDALERQSGVSASTLSVLFRGGHIPGEDNAVRKIREWYENTQKRIAALKPVGICDTAIVRAVRTGCDFAKSQGCMVAVVGPSGIGKTVAAQAYCAEDLTAICVRIRSTDTPASFARHSAEAGRVEAGRSASATMDALGEKYRNSHRLWIYDEWHLARRELHEVVRDFFDTCGVPMVFIGTDVIKQQVVRTRMSKGSVWSDQFTSRIGWLLDLTHLTSESGKPRPLFTLDEVRQVFRADRVRLAPDAAAFLQSLACSEGLGCLRAAQRCFVMAARIARNGDGIVTASMLRKAFRQQAVPGGCDESLFMRRLAETHERVAAMAG